MYVICLLIYAIGRFLFVYILIIVDLLFIAFSAPCFPKKRWIITFLLSRSTRQFKIYNATPYSYIASLGKSI